MFYKEPVELHFDYNGNDVKFYIQGELGKNLEISCSHEVFVDTIGGYTIYCPTAHMICLEERAKGRKQEFIYFMSQAITERHREDYDKEHNI